VSDPERAYFTNTAADALKAFHEQTDAAPKPAMLSALVMAINQSTMAEDPQAALEEVLNVRYVTYGQLQHVSDPPIHRRSPPRNQSDYVPERHYETYTVSETSRSKGKEMTRDVTYVQAPRVQVRFHPLAPVDTPAHLHTARIPPKYRPSTTRVPPEYRPSTTRVHLFTGWRALRACERAALAMDLLVGRARQAARF